MESRCLECQKRGVYAPLTYAHAAGLDKWSRDELRSKQPYPGAQYIQDNVGMLCNICIMFDWLNRLAVKMGV